MTFKLSLHATYPDIAGWLRAWRDVVRFDVAAEYFRPVYCASSWHENVDATPDRLSLHLEPPDLSARTATEFTLDNPMALLILVGHRTETGLHETLLEATTTDRRSLWHWRHLIARTIPTLKTGGWQQNRTTGERHRIETHLYTQAASHLQEAGVSILGLTDALTHELD
ncbi:hypothetical protein [Kribbella sp. NPDC048915]|uniref:hypothetical protein n=1 Tax=Kribbella sp. NPDC048915 TaxID=3155148 RepID=UPI0033E8F614